MKNRRAYLIGELVLLFVLIPCILVFEISMVIKAGVVLSGIIFVAWTALKNRLITGRSLYSLPSKPYWKYILFRFIVLIICTTILMYFSDSEKLFLVVRKKPMLWLSISIFYTVISVYPQEFLYRSFFFSRYGLLFKNHYLLISVNALVFCFAHIGFKNLLVLCLTLAGGLIFAITYLKTKSLLLTTIEHALYGSWLFTVGMGEMLAFPMPD